MLISAISKLGPQVNSVDRLALAPPSVFASEYS